MKKNKTKEIKYYEFGGRKFFFSDKNLVKNNSSSIIFKDGEQTKRILLLYASTDFFGYSNIIEKLGVSSEDLEQEFPKARRALFLYEIEAINNDNESESENMENNNEVS